MAFGVQFTDDLMGEKLTTPNAVDSMATIF